MDKKLRHPYKRRPSNGQCVPLIVSGISGVLTGIYVNFGIYGLFPLIPLIYGIHGIPLIFPLYFRIITLVCKSDLFPRNYVGL